MPSAGPRTPPRAPRAAALALALGLSACSSLEFERTTETSGTFRSSAWAFTILSVDLPKGALLIARENASDANLPNMQVTKTHTRPHLGWFSWIFDVLSMRYARIEGTWGFESID